MAIIALAMAVNMMAGDFVKVKNGRFVRGGNPTITWAQTSGMDLYLALKDQEETVRVFVVNSMRCSVWVLITSVFWLVQMVCPVLRIR